MNERDIKENEKLVDQLLIWSTVLSSFAFAFNLVTLLI